MTIQTVPCLSDNLCYLIIDEGSKSCVIVDPSEAKPFLDTIARQGLKLEAILATHHHYDHIGGLSELPDVPVWSSQRDLDRIPGAGGGKKRRSVTDGEIFTWTDLTDGKYPNSEISFSVLGIPGHTEGQVAYVFKGADGIPHVFVGDTLFAFGCGRCLEGSPEELFDSLQKIKRLAPESRIYFGHDYTERNALFWLSQTSSDDAGLISRAEIEVELRASAQAPYPKEAPTLASELHLNPFLKIKNANEFRRWRELRNHF